MTYQSIFIALASLTLFGILVILPSLVGYATSADIPERTVITFTPRVDYTFTEARSTTSVDSVTPVTDKP